MKAQRDSASFVLRFTQDHWQDAQGKPCVEWRGHIRHVQNGAERHFVDMLDAMAFIEDTLLRLTENCTQQADAPYRAQALRESNRIWERFALMYAEHLAERLETSLTTANAGRAEANGMHDMPADGEGRADSNTSVAGRVLLLRNLVGVLEDRLDHQSLI